MRYGLTVPNFGEYFDPRVLAALASDAERAGWDGFFLWDHTVAWPTAIVDPLIALSAIAIATKRIRIGPLVTPLPRRRPTKLAREVVSLDHLSNGRMILGVGIGAGPWEWDYLGEETDLRTRGAMLDEGLELLTKLFSGEPVLHDGRFYAFRGDGGPGSPEPLPTPFLPTPVQQPRVPIWVAGTWPGRPPFRRAARWDGVVPVGRSADMVSYLSPDDVRDVVAFVGENRSSAESFDVVVAGHTSADDTDDATATVQSYDDVGATWWLEDVSPWAFGWQWDGPWPIDQMNDRVRAGPPRLPGDC
ncbi:LLM class flavin-dependent oxidoreductase [Mycobacterium sp.]|uniref:LLM class flavin-dependent oxidoreductase n=1 Tax=Mycobacterium sp. TaxID=1785 RepID=UPI002DAEE9DA|nr:LLM class flavin-dependent oxidoreductase [Mycobacterium sp.]